MRAAARAGAPTNEVAQALGQVPSLVLRNKFNERLGAD